MRLLIVKISLPLVLGSVMVLGQEAQPGPNRSSHEQTPSKQENAKASHATSHHAARRTHSVVPKDRKRTARRPAYTRNSVEVINGSSTEKVIFRDEKSSNAKQGKATGPMKVEVLNGASKDTQYFYADNRRLQAQRRAPVVVGVQSSNTRTAGGNQHPVVTGIASSETTTAKAAQSSTEPVTTGVSPQPKRPEYKPEE